MKKISRKGRPRKDAITKLKVMAWFRAVAEASGKTAAQLEREFANPDHIWRSKDKNKEIRPGLWDKYRRGEVEPRLLPTKEKPISLIQAVEAKYPGTARILALPLWKLLDFAQPVTLEELVATEKTLSPTMQRLHLEENVPSRELSHHIEMSEAERLDSHLHVGETIEHWTMQVILMRKSVLTQQEYIIRLMCKSLVSKSSRNQTEQRKKQVQKKFQRPPYNKRT